MNRLKIVLFGVFLCAVSTYSFADCFFIKNNLNGSIEVQAIFNNRDQEKSPTTKQLFFISNSAKLQEFPLDDRNTLRGLVDYQFIQIQDNNKKEICHKDFSTISPNKALKIQVDVFENHCDWQVKEVGSVKNGQVCHQ